MLLLTAPMTPLLFMGQEWAASTPFQFFTDLEPGLGAQVTTGRTGEFRDFPEFGDPAGAARIPDPQDAATFERSKLNWAERERDPHRRTLALYTELLRLRRMHASLGASTATDGQAHPADEDTIVMRRGGLMVVTRLAGAGTIAIDRPAEAAAHETILSTEDPRFAVDPTPIDVAVDSRQVIVTFSRPGAVLLTW